MPVYFDIPRLVSDWPGIDPDRYEDGTIPRDEMVVLLRTFPDLELGFYVDPFDQEFWAPRYNPVKHHWLKMAMTFPFQKPIGEHNYYLPPIAIETGWDRGKSEPPRCVIDVQFSYYDENWLSYLNNYAYTVDWLSAEQALERIAHYAPDPYSVTDEEWYFSILSYAQAHYPQPYTAVHYLYETYLDWDYDALVGKFSWLPPEYLSRSLVGAVEILESHLEPAKRSGGAGAPWVPVIPDEPEPPELLTNKVRYPLNEPEDLPGASSVLPS